MGARAPAGRQARPKRTPGQRRRRRVLTRFGAGSGSGASLTRARERRAEAPRGVYRPALSARIRPYDASNVSLGIEPARAAASRRA